jgi:hypothetical protein
MSTTPPQLKMTAPSPPPSLRPNGTSTPDRTTPPIPAGNNTPARTPRSGTPIATTHLSLPGKGHKIHEKTGYNETRFAGKEEQLRLVIKSLRQKGFIPHELVETEVLSPSLAPVIASANVRHVGFTVIWGSMMPILHRNLSRRLSIIFYPCMELKLLLLQGMIQILKLDWIGRKLIMPFTLILQNLEFPIFQVLSMNNGIFPLPLCLVLLCGY